MGYGFLTTLSIAFWYAVFDTNDYGTAGIGAFFFTTGAGAGAGAATAATFGGAFLWVALSRAAYNLALALNSLVFFCFSFYCFAAYLAASLACCAAFSAASFSRFAFSFACYSSCSFRFMSAWNSSSASFYSTSLSLFWTIAVMEPNPSKSSRGSSSSTGFFSFLLDDFY